MPVSPTTGAVWERLRSTIEQNYPGVVVTPYVQTGATDSRSFGAISTAIYRFTPFELSAEERGALHAMNERMHVATYLRGIEFYRALVGTL
jgi:carboxypeptidase PM20D1